MKNLYFLILFLFVSFNANSQNFHFFQNANTLGASNHLVGIGYNNWWLSSEGESLKIDDLIGLRYEIGFNDHFGLSVGYQRFLDLEINATAIAPKISFGSFAFLPIVSLYFDDSDSELNWSPTVCYDLGISELFWITIGSNYKYFNGEFSEGDLGFYIMPGFKLDSFSARLGFHYSSVEGVGSNGLGLEVSYLIGEGTEKLEIPIIFSKEPKKF